MQYDCDINALLLKVAKHVEAGLYFIISMNASPHFLTVVCGCQKMEKDFPEDMWRDPAFVDEDWNEGGKCELRSGEDTSFEK